MEVKHTGKGWVMLPAWTWHTKIRYTESAQEKVFHFYRAIGTQVDPGIPQCFKAPPGGFSVGISSRLQVVHRSNVVYDPSSRVVVCTTVGRSQKFFKERNPDVIPELCPGSWPWPQGRAKPPFKTSKLISTACIHHAFSGSLFKAHDRGWELECGLTG